MESILVCGCFTEVCIEIAVKTDILKDGNIFLHQIGYIADYIDIKVNTYNTEYMSYNLNRDFNIIIINGNSIT